MGLNAFGLGFLFTATDMASGVMSNVNKNFKGLEEQSGKSIANLDAMTKSLGAGLATTAIGVGGLAASFAVADKAGEFEQALAAVGAVSNASAEDLAALRKAAIEAGKNTQFSPTQAVLGLNELAQAGYNAKESIELLQPSLALAAGSLGDLSPQEAAGLASQGLKAFGIDSSLAGRAVDQLLQSANAFAVKPKDLALGLGTVSSGAQTLNQSLTETVIAFGLVKNVIPGTERAATSIKVAMERLANPKVQKALKAQGVAVTDSNGDYRQFLDILKDLSPAMSKMTEGEKGAFLMKAFGTEGLAGVNAMFSQFDAGIKGADGQVRKGGDAIDYLRKQFAGANGVAEDFSKKMLNTFEGSKTLLSGSVETLAILIGEPFRDVFRPMVEATTTAFNALIDILDGMSPTAKKFFASVVVGAFALTTLVGVILLAEAAWPLLAAGFGLLTGAIGSMAVAAGSALLAMWPFVLVGAAIAAVVYAIQHNIGGLGDTWDRVVEMFSGGGKILSAVFDTVVNYAKGLWDSLSKGFSEVFDEFGPLFTDVGNAIETLMDSFKSLGSNFDDTTSGPGQNMLAFVKYLGGGLADLIGLLVWVVKWVIIFGAAIVQAFSGIVSFVKPIIQGIADSLGFWVDKIMWLVDKITGAWKIFQAVMAGPSVLSAAGQKPSASGERGIVDHKGDAVGRSNTRGLGANAPEAITLADQGKMTPLSMPASATAAAAVASLADQGETVHPNPIDYDKMAAANAKQPINVNLNVDGEKLATVAARGQRTANARSGGRDMEEP